MKTHPIYKEILKKCKALKEGQLLYTTFGAYNYYTITIREDGYAIDEFKNKYSFQKKGNRLSSGFFNNEEDLEVTIRLNPSWYARNHFSGELVHMDNWKEFLKAFKLSELVMNVNESLAQPNDKSYFYEPIKEVNN